MPSLLSRDSNPRIYHFELKLNIIIFLSNHLYFDFHTAFQGELHSIPYDVGEDLFKTVSITEYGSRNGIVQAKTKIQLLLSDHWCYDINRLGHDFSEIKGFIHQIGFARLYFGKVQNIINDCKQRIPALLDDLNVFLLFSAESRCIQKQIRHSDHP